MISAISTSKNYVIQPSLIKKHKITLQWLSSLMLWKSELLFFQKTLEDNAGLFYKVADKKKVDHFQNLITYYGGEVIDGLRSKLRHHEGHVASMLKTKNETLTEYFKEHDALMEELETFEKSYKDMKRSFLRFIAKANKLDRV